MYIPSKGAACAQVQGCRRTKKSAEQLEQGARGQECEQDRIAQEHVRLGVRMHPQSRWNIAKDLSM